MYWLHLGVNGEDQAWHGAERYCWFISRLRRKHPQVRSPKQRSASGDASLLEFTNRILTPVLKGQNPFGAVFQFRGLGSF